MTLAAVDNLPSTSAAVEMTHGARDQPRFSGQPIMIGELKWRPNARVIALVIDSEGPLPASPLHF